MRKNPTGPSPPRPFRSLSAKLSVFTGLVILWVVLVVLYYDFQQNNFQPSKGLVLLTLAGVLAAAIARFTATLLVRPLTLLQQGLEAVGKGRREPLRLSETGDEIEYLGESFNRMIAALAASEKEIREHHESLEEKIRQRTESLEEAMHRARAASQSKSEFLANMSHELRTPMNGVLGMIDIVLDSELSAEQRDNLETAQRSALTLLSLVNDILDLSKIEANKMALERIPFAVRRLVRECLDTNQPRAREKKITLEAVYEGDLDREVVGDPLRLRQIVTNLVSNAVKFTEKGSVSVRVSTQPVDSGNCVLQIEVKDTGPGIPAEKLPLIFEKFTQADGSISRRYGGTGLGLAITKKLVDMHGGQIIVESEVNQGSTFRVLIPYELAAATAAAAGDAEAAVQHSTPAPAANISGARILVVEDNVVNQRVVTAILKKKGFKIAVANHGREALDALERSEYDLVLMDVQMPVLDGLETTKLIRSDPRWHDLPIVAMTAHALNGDRERCLDVGMNEYISKPVHSAHLVATVTSNLAARAHDFTAEPAEASSSPIIEEDTSLTESMLHLFLQTAPERLQIMQSAAKRQDMSSLSAEARKLGQAAERINADPIAGCARRIQDASGRADIRAVKHTLLLLEAEIIRLNRQADVVEVR